MFNGPDIHSIYYVSKLLTACTLQYVMLLIQAYLF